MQTDGACDDDDLLHKSPSGSQQKVASAVEIPTPTKKRSPALPTAANGSNATTSRNTNANMTNVSFNSTSSLTSLPLSSQASSSRRIVKDGVPLVTNSDSGSAEDSEDELQDIILPRKKMRMTPPPGENETQNAAQEFSTAKPPARHSGRHFGSKGLGSSRSNTPRGRLSPSPPRPANTSSLLRLVREKEKREKAEAKIREAEAAFETEQKLRGQKKQRERDLDSGFKELVADDSDEGERMMLAVERTEAMGDQEEDFFYFRGVRDDVDVREPRADDIAAFKLWDGPRFARLKKIVTDVKQREHAVLSGFLAEVAGTHGLPPEVMDWMFQRLAREPREEVREACVEVFRQYLRWQGREDGALDQNWAWLSRVYQTVDVSADGIDKGEARRLPKLQSLPLGLRQVFRVVQFACSSGQSSIPARNFLELALASVDTHVSKDAELKGQVEESMTAILDSFTIAGINTIAHTVSTATSSLSLPLRCRIVRSLPASTANSHRLRRILALYLLGGESVPKSDGEKAATAPAGAAATDPNSPHWSKTLLSRLRSAPEWHISESANYTHLNALIPILDIAIDAGFGPPPNATTAIPAKAASAFPSKPPAQTPEEKTFNASVDALTDTLRLLGARIRDAGTSHLRRTEAKSAMERVVVRLEHCVRTRPRPRKGVFGGGGGGTAFMEGFLAKTVEGSGRVKGDRHPEDRVSVVGEERLSDRGGDSEAESEGEDVVGGAEDDF